MSIVEKMARGYVEYHRKLHEEAARVEDYENYEWAELLALMSAALTATGLPEAQLEGLANGTMVVVPVERPPSSCTGGNVMTLAQYTISRLLERANATDDAHLARHLRECAAEIAAMENEEAK